MKSLIAVLFALFIICPKPSNAEVAAQHDTFLVNHIVDGFTAIKDAASTVAYMPVPNCDPRDGCPGCPNGGTCPANAPKTEEVAAVSLWAWFFDYRVDPSNTGGVTGSW
jgi:hypothetical protein